MTYPRVYGKIFHFSRSIRSNTIYRMTDVSYTHTHAHTYIYNIFTYKQTANAFYSLVWVRSGSPQLFIFNTTYRVFIMYMKNRLALEMHSGL